MSDVAGPSGLRMSRRPAALPPETASSSNNDPLTDLSDFCLQPDPAMTEEEARFFQEEQDAVSPINCIFSDLEIFFGMRARPWRQCNDQWVHNSLWSAAPLTDAQPGGYKKGGRISTWHQLRLILPASGTYLGYVLSGRFSRSCDFEP